jgi:hypothetical protein
MSETPATPARPVSLFTIVFLFVVFAAFVFAVRNFYDPHVPAAQSLAVENVAKDFEWRATSDARRAALKQLREEQAKKATSYAWINKDAGVVQLPVERAMELIAQENASKQQFRQIRDLPSVDGPGRKL